MEVTSTKAALVGNGDVEAASRLTVTLPRFEVEAALSDTEQPELVLDVLRGMGPDRDAERHTISVAWDRADVEKLLSETPGDAITFAFKPEEIELLIDHDTEAHGLREKALVLSVAVGVAATSATGAMAGYDQIGPPDRPVPATAVSAPDEQTLEQRGIVTPAAAVNDERTLADRGIEQTAVSLPEERTLAERGIEPTVVSQPEERTLAERGIEPTVVSRPDERTLAQRGVPDDVVALPDEAGLTQRGIETPAATSVAVSADDGISIDPSTAAALGLAGGMGLLIAGAAFVARRRQAPHPA